MSCKKCAECCNLTAMINKDELISIKYKLSVDIEVAKKVNKEVERRSKEIETGTIDLRCLFRDVKSKECLIYDYRPKICRSYKCWISEKGNDKKTSALKSKLEKEGFIIGDIFSFPRVLINEHYKRQILEHLGKQGV